MQNRSKVLVLCFCFTTALTISAVAQEKPAIVNSHSAQIKIIGRHMQALNLQLKPLRLEMHKYAIKMQELRYQISLIESKMKVEEKNLTALNYKKAPGHPATAPVANAVAH